MMPESVTSHRYPLVGFKKSTNASRIATSPRFGSLNEWRRMESAVAVKGYTPNKPKMYDIAMVQSPERKEASGINGDREKEDTH